ncbi:dihydropyrimidinase [Raineyella sp. LH-20]|uniref:dihydropyrimidinase n=1 Tax=Raineyella sp. LH-20 TaxID=3081204 RepID=UPI002953F05F|nr:dihydropyrimidinase [Raineyella sp. LH-20]WOP19619.1 dihydropyrimidinase [Raineyella sp. LH-20]
MSELIAFVGGEIADESGSRPADVLVRDGVIVGVGMSDAWNLTAARIVDCTGRVLLPGGIDVHTHMESGSFEQRTSDDFFTGTRAAAVGGTTTIIDYASQLPGLTVSESVARHAGSAAGKAVIDFGLHAAVTRLYDGFDKEFRTLAGDGITSVKTYMAYRGTLMIDDGELFRVLSRAGSAGMQVCVHAENGDIIDVLAADLVARGVRGPEGHLLSRPPSTESEAVARAIRISRMAEAPLYFVHMSTSESVDLIGEARVGGWPIGGETCTHYLSLGPDEYYRPDFGGARAVLTPPLREEPHRNALWRGLSSGVLGIVSSDHCPYCFATQKTDGRDDFRKIPNGGPGVEHRMLVTYSEGVHGGRIDLGRFVSITAAEPARRFGLYPRKGVLAPGSDADIVVLDPAGTTHISAASQLQNIDYTLWEDVTAHGRFDQVWSRGELVAEQGRPTEAGNRAGRGRFLLRATVG